MARTTVWFAGVRAPLVCWGVVALLLGCSGNGLAPSTSSVGGAEQTTAITVKGPGGASVTVPPGASPTPMSIAITQGSSSAPALEPALQLGSAVFAITPHGAAFAAPVTVRIPVGASVDPGALLTVLHAEEGGPWEELTSYARDDDAVEVEVTRFSYFVVVVRTITAPSTAPTMTITPLEPGWVQGALGSWTYSGDPAPAPVLVPFRVSVTGTPSCPSGQTPGIVAFVGGGTGHRRFFHGSPRAAAWPADAIEIDLPLLLDVAALRDIATQTGSSKTTLTMEAFLICMNGPPVGSLAQSNLASRDLLVGSPVGLGAGAGPADQTIAPGVRPSFSTEILGGPQDPTASDQYVVDWQRSDDDGHTWRAAYDAEAYELQMEPDPHLAATGSEQGFLVRRSVFTAPAARQEDDGALFQARACYRIPAAFQQFSPATTSCVFSRAARLTVSGTTVAPGSPTITQQPQDVAVTVPAPGTFSVVATGDAPLAYQWLRNGVAIPGANGASYTTAATAMTDSGETFSVVVWNHGGAVVSAGARLTVNAAAGFQVVQVDPADASVGNSAATLAASTATFSGDLDCGHLPANSFQVLEGASTIPGTVGCSGKTLSFTPASGAFPTNTTLHVLLDPGIGDGAGHTLGAAYTWSFGVAPWTRQIGSPSYDEARAVRVDAQGNVFAVGYTQGGLDGNTLTGTNDLFAVKYAPSGARLWTRQLGVAGTSTDALSAAVDGAGNLYVAGECGGALDGNTSNGSSDIVLVKYDPAGTKLWTHQYGTAADDHVGGVAIDAGGHVYLSAWTQGSFGGLPTAGAEDIVVLKLDPDGNVQWIRDTGSPATDEPTSVAVDGSGNVLVAGYTTGVLAGPGNAGAFDLFVAKFDPAGTYLWARQLGTSGIDVATAVAADASGNVYVTGYTYGSLDGHPNQGSIDGFVLKYDASGAKQWSVLLGTPGDDFGIGIAVDASGSPYVVGRTSGALDGGGNNSAAQLYVAGLDPTTGSLRWVYQEGAMQFGFDTAQGVVVDSQNNVFASGFTNGGLDGNTSAGDYDAFVVKLETSGRKR